MRIMVADRLPGSVVERLEEAGCEVLCEPALSGDALVERLAGWSPKVLVVRSTKVERRHLEAAPALALVVRAGAGFNTIDVACAAERAVHVTNCPGRNAVAVAELTLGHLINLDRRISDQVQALREGRWAKKAFGTARGLEGRTLAVLGVGAIGAEVIARARAFGMTVRAWSRSLTAERAAELGCERAASPLEAARGADALTVHVALTPETRNLVGRELLDALNPGAYVVNTARGGIVDEAALCEAIERRGLRAALDVFEREPSGGEGVFDDVRIRENPAVYGTHHIAASTEQASEAVADDVVRIVLRFLRTGVVDRGLNLAERTAASHALVVRHQDRVGVLARVLGCLSEAGINVEEMANTVFDGCRAATARIQTSCEPSAELVARIEALDEVFAVDTIALRDAAHTGR